MKKLSVAIILLLISGSEIKCDEVEEKPFLNKTRIVGGDVIKITEAPYQASLAFDNRFICGASIISTQYLLTAAHCKKKNSFFLNL